MTELSNTFVIKSRATQPKQLNKQGASYSVKHPGVRSRPGTPDHGGHKAIRNACRIRIDSSCGYACFWGLFGLLAAFWRVFEVVLQVRKLRTLNGVVARVQSIRDNMQVIGLKIVVMALIRNTSMLGLRL